MKFIVVSWVIAVHRHNVVDTECWVTVYNNKERRKKKNSNLTNGITSPLEKAFNLFEWYIQDVVAITLAFEKSTEDGLRSEGFPRLTCPAVVSRINGQTRRYWPREIAGGGGDGILWWWVEKRAETARTKYHCEFDWNWTSVERRRTETTIAEYEI